METISVEEAEDIVFGNYIACQDVSEHRWYTRQLVVFHGDEGLMGFYYDKPATEMQEGMDTFESDPVKVFPVVAREIVTTVYYVAT